MLAQAVGIRTPVYADRLMYAKILATQPIGYWPHGEASGTTAYDRSGNNRNGSYTSALLAQTGIGDGRTSMGGAADALRYMACTSAGLLSAFSATAGSVALWCKVTDAGVWTDGTVRWVFHCRVDANNYVAMGRTATNGQLLFTYVAGGTASSVTASGLSSTGWMNLIMTWNKAADQVKAYINGTYINVAGSMGTWAGTILGLLVHGYNSSSTAWSGLCQHSAVWARVLAPAEIWKIGRV